MLHETIKKTVAARSLITRALYPEADNMVITGQNSAEQADIYAQMLAGKQRAERVYTVNGSDLAHVAGGADVAYFPQDPAIYVIHALYDAEPADAQKAVDELITLYDTSTIILSGEQEKIAKLLKAHPPLADRMAGNVIALEPVPSPQGALPAPTPAAAARKPRR